MYKSASKLDDRSSSSRNLNPNDTDGRRSELRSPHHKSTSSPVSLSSKPLSSANYPEK